jgi:hypothetical protein
VVHISEEVDQPSQILLIQFVLMKCYNHSLANIPLRRLEQQPTNVKPEGEADGLAPKIFCYVLPLTLMACRRTHTPQSRKINIQTTKALPVWGPQY